MEKANIEKMMMGFIKGQERESNLESSLNLEYLKKNRNEPKRYGWGGRRRGAGRPLGSIEELKRKEIEAKEYIKMRVIESIKPLVDSQLNLAKGCQYLYRITVEINAEGKKVRGKPELVINPEEIEAYLADDYDKDSEYYFITTEKPDNKAIDSTFDRTFGKAGLSIDLTTKGNELVLYDKKQLEAIAGRTLQGGSLDGGAEGENIPSGLLHSDESEVQAELAS